ncbi:hypothetical protein ACHAO7_001986 [Fusarium culmorum]
MSMPPQLIRVKRKRDDESPVTFLRGIAGSVTVGVTSTSDSNLVDPSAVPEHRRFHISKKMMMASGSTTQNGPGLNNKRPRYGPAVFVERSRAKASQRASSLRESIKESISLPAGQQIPGVVMPAQPQQERRLKKPSARSRQNSPLPDANSRTPLPTSVMNPHNQDISKRAADMNDWVMKEIGANLEKMEQEKQKTSRFKPKAPAQRYQERHPEAATGNTDPNDVDMTTDNISSDMEDDDDWVIEEYVRIPAHAMTINVAPTDVGVLVLDGKEESNMFFGPERDEDDELDEDDEDENAENYYTADYPEEEVDSDDEYGRHAYDYRNGNASDDEEFDNDYYEDDMVLDDDEDEDATMARIRTYVKRSRAFE